MKRRILSLFLTLCMILSMMPVSLMAEEKDIMPDEKEKIVAFNDALETNITVPKGTAIEDLKLPKTLNVTVRAVPENSVPGAGELEDWSDVTTSQALDIEFIRDIPVVWTSEPEYNMTTQGEYVFTPVIVGYMISAKLPEIKVIVGSAEKNMLLMAGASTTVKDESELQQAFENAEDGETIVLEKSITVSNPIIIDDETDKNITLDLHGYYLSSSIEGAIIQHKTKGTLTIINSGTKSGYAIKNYKGRAIEITAGGTLTIAGEKVTIQAEGDCVIQNESSTVNILGSTIDAAGSSTDGIQNLGTGVINLLGGSIYGRQYGINDFHGSGVLNISEKAFKLKGNVLAMNNIYPNFGDMIVTAYTATNSDSPVICDMENLSDYHYLLFEPDSGYVAQIGTTSYSTLQQAILEANSGDTIRLLRDINLNETATIPGGNITLDLNGKKITSSNTVIMHRGSGMLTIDDSSSGGEMKVIDGYSACVCVVARGGSLTVKGGTIIGNTSGIYSESYTGSINVSGGKVIAIQDDGDGISNTNNSSVNITGGEVIGVNNGIYNYGSQDFMPQVNVVGGLISGGYHGIYYNNSKGGNVIVYGSAIIKGTDAAISENAKLILKKARIVKACSDFIGETPIAFDRNNLEPYKYLEFEKIPFPTGKIEFKDNTFSDFQRSATFSGFYRDSLDVTITAQDEDSGVKKVEYLISPLNYTTEEEAGSKSGWQTVNNGESFTVTANKKGYIYARLTSNNDMVKIIRSDGIVVYTNSQISTPTIRFTKGSNTDISAQVHLNGNTIKKITTGLYTLSDTDYTVSDGVITFKASYLNTLLVKDEPYTFFVYYNPQGVEYPSSPLKGSQQPDVSGMNLVIFPKPLEIMPATLPDGTQGQSYIHQLQTDSIESPIWDISRGSLPDGLGLTINGLIAGTPLSTGTFSFDVTVSDGTNTGTRSFSITINPPDPVPLGGLAIINNSNNHPVPRIGDILTGSLIGGNNTGILSYTWKSGDSVLGTGQSYEVTHQDLGKSIMLEITSSKETGTVLSMPTAPVVKKAPPTSPAAPTLVSKTDRSVILTANEDYEFSIDGMTWQREHIFTGLSADTSYSFYQRIAETDDTECSEKSMALVVTTDPQEVLPDPLTGTAVINNNTPRIGDTLTGFLEGGNNTGLLSYTWKANGMTLGIDPSYEVTRLDLGRRIILEITSSKETGTVTSTQTAEVRKKAASNAPQAPILGSKTHNSVTLVANRDYEFSKDGMTWQKNHVFSGLLANTTYIFYQRIAEIDDTESSEKSIGLRVTTNANNNSGGSGSGSGSGSGNGGNSSGSNNPETTTPPGEDKPNSPEENKPDSSEANKPNIPEMTDISAHWAKDDIAFVVERGLLKGTDTHTFSPDTKMTRGMFVTVLGRLAQADTSSYTSSSFTDVANDTYYAAFIEWATKHSIVNGMGNRTFAPNEPITREQMVAMLYSYTKAMGINLPQIKEEINFTDSDQISEYAKEAVKIMQRAGIIGGKEGKLFDPKGEASRAEVSAVLSRFVKLLGLEESHTESEEE